MSVLHALIAPIVGIDEPGRELRWKDANGKAMILRRNVAALCVVQEAGLILTPVPKFQLVGVPTCGKCQ